MSRYLSHLAALTLHQVEPVQPRLASRFETLDSEPAIKNSLDVVQQVSDPPVRVQTATAMATDNPVIQKTVTTAAYMPVQKEASRQEPPKIIEQPELVIKKFESPSHEQKPSINQRGFSPVDTEPVSHRATQFVDKPVTHELRHTPLPIENTHTFVERVQERFTETTHSERVIKEVSATDRREKESPHSAPVKPVSIAVRSEQITRVSNIPSQTVLPSQSSSETPTPAPTIQVTIGRIEIRASQSTEKSVTKPRTTNTTMSLDDYLKQRNGGRT